MKKIYVSPSLHSNAFSVDVVCSSTQVLGDDNCIFWTTERNLFGEGDL